MIDRLAEWLFFVRGVHRPLTVGIAMALKYHEGRTTPIHLFLLGLAIVVVGETLRVWSAAYLRGAHAVTHVGADFLCTTGPYARVRNPLYLGHVVIGLGLATMIGEWYALLLIPTTQLIVYSLVISYEERFLADKFGSAFEAYRERTPRLIPHPGSYGVSADIAPDWKAGMRGENHVVLLAIICIAIYVLFVARG